jgi:hypothetical protein
MGRRARTELDDLLEAWARWCVSGSLSSGSRSLLARWMDSRGHVVFGSGGADCVSALAFPIEERVEAVVVAMATDDLLMADVLRLEYNAAAHYVVQRRRIKGYDARYSTQVVKAHALGISVRTYRSRLAAARWIIERRVKDADR